MNEQMQKTPQRMTFSTYINTEKGKQQISKVIQNPAKREAFITAIVAAVSVNAGLQECTSSSIIAAALQGVALGLAPSPQLGQFYMLPFDCKFKDENGNWRKEKRASFVPGYKGYIQLAYRSGQYLDIDAFPVVEGEYKGRDRFTGRYLFEWIEDDSERESKPVIGYMAYFELINGARKVLYWSREKMLKHADRYAPAFDRYATTGRYPKVSFEDYCAGNYPKGDEWKYSSFWYKDFDSMANKTMLRQLITKWGPVSVEMEKVITRDIEQERMEAEMDLQPNDMLPPPPVDEMEPDGQGVPEDDPAYEVDESTGEVRSLDDL